MWFEFKSITKEQKVSTKTGKEYDCYVLRGTMLGSETLPARNYERILFDNTSVTVIEDDGAEQPNMSAVQFFQRGVNPGDVVTLMFTKALPKTMYAVRRGKIYGDGNSARNLPNAYVPPQSNANSSSVRTESSTSGSVGYGSWEGDDDIPF